MHKSTRRTKKATLNETTLEKGYLQEVISVYDSAVSYGIQWSDVPATDVV